MNRRTIGKEKEELAASFLRDQGYRVIEKNFRCRAAEIDLIAWEGNILSFIEVKYRSSSKLGDPLEAVGPVKQKRIYEAALYFISKKRIASETQMRFDVVSILGEEITLIKNAFMIS